MDANMLSSMKVSGNILLDKRGAFPHVHKHNINYAVYDFTSMVKEADACKDTLYYDSEEWELFYAYGYDPANDYWKGFGSIAYEQLFINSNPLFKPTKIGGINDFETKPTPRILGGFMCDGCPTEDYIYDKSSIDKWHSQWFKDNPDKINWTKTNGIMPSHERVIEILRRLLSDLKDNKDNQKSLSHQEAMRLDSLDVDNLDSTIVVNEFYELIMGHKGKSGDIIAFALELAEEICEANYYHYENALVKLENDYRKERNNHHRIQKIINERQKNIPNKKKEYKIYEISAIYSIIKNGKYQFLSVDTQHGMFELCDEKGNHLGEYRFDGSPNGNGTEEADHGLYCIEDWLRKNNKQ